jgi:hypothetical protein
MTSSSSETVKAARWSLMSCQSDFSSRVERELPAVAMDMRVPALLASMAPRCN